MRFPAEDSQCLTTLTQLFNYLTSHDCSPKPIISQVGTTEVSATVIWTAVLMTLLKNSVQSLTRSGSRHRDKGALRLNIRCQLILALLYLKERVQFDVSCDYYSSILRQEGGRGPDADDDDDANVVMMCTHIQTGVILQALQCVRISWITCLLSNIVFGSECVIWEIHFCNTCSSIWTQTIIFYDGL